MCTCTTSRVAVCLVQNRELEIGIYWKDWRQLCAVKFLRLEEFIEDNRHGMVIEMEPQGILFAEVKFLMNPMISRKPNLKRQRVFQRESSTFAICSNVFCTNCART